jgi:pyrroloquinoline quinone (PQQ) biosynthesis protein C
MEERTSRNRWRTLNAEIHPDSSSSVRMIDDELRNSNRSYQTENGEASTAFIEISSPYHCRNASQSASAIELFPPKYAYENISEYYYRNPSVNKMQMTNFINHRHQNQVKNQIPERNTKRTRISKSYRARMLIRHLC